MFEGEGLFQRLPTYGSICVGVYDISESVAAPAPSRVPVSLVEMEAYFTQSLHFADRFTLHPDIQHAYLLKLDDGELAVTFNPQVFDEHPNTVRFITYGSDVFEHLINEVQQPASVNNRPITRSVVGGSLPEVRYQSEDGKPIDTLEEFLAGFERLV